MKNPRDIILGPVVSEKSYGLMDANTYTFFVHPNASKPEIKQAIASIFEVKVLRVNTLNRPGKKVRARRVNKVGSKPDTKRAIVTLAEGSRIELFES
jgi:large subunit ribosomal protein L23